jgi:hypothetical protein
VILPGREDLPEMLDAFRYSSSRIFRIEQGAI